uniref:BSD domain-containing protein n=1 Tax=Fagus sylvatica TaxID=28930 RepID=A0A2N9IUB3_FAGSY
MDFFKSVFSDDPDPLQPQNDDDSEPNPDPNSNDTWSFGGLIKTIASRSESTIQNYKRELEEFGSGLKKETAVIREVASRAVKDLPGSLDVGASVAQESLESVGQAIDDIGASVWKSTAEIISHGTDKLLGPDPDSDSNSSDNNNTRIGTRTSQLSDLKRYSRFESQVRSIQCDLNTYLDEPKEDFQAYDEWKLGFVLDEKVEEARAKLVKRVISGEEEEDLSWDFDDDDQDGENNVSVSKVESSGDNVVLDDKSNVGIGGVMVEMRLGEQEGKTDSVESGRDSDVSVVSSQPLLPEEEDLGWDEIDDIGSNDENKGDDGVGSSDRVDLRRRLSMAEEEEDLSWDIEDDDDDDLPIKS